MDLHTIIDALILGIVEGITEFLPVSSTAHLLLVGRLLGFEDAGKAFEVLIQLGAILALLSVYAGRLWHLAVSLPRDRTTQRFVLGIFIAFLPAAILGVALHGFITRVMFESVTLICHHADPRRHRAAVHRPAADEAALPRDHGLSARALPRHRAFPDAWR